MPPNSPSPVPQPNKPQGAPESKPPTPPVQSQTSEVVKAQELTPDQWQAALDHMDSVGRYIMEFAGKEGMNPFIYNNKHIIPLRQQFEAGQRNPALYMKIMSLEKKEPVAPDNKFQSRV